MTFQKSIYEGRGTKDEGRNRLSSIVQVKRTSIIHRRFSSVFWLLIAGFWLLISGVCQAQQQEEFIYDSEGRRDPFIPLTDRKSSTGLRITFTPPEVKVKLPMEIKIKGILWNGTEYYAIVNEKVMKKGQSLGEVKIKEIKKDRVIVQYGEREFTLFLKEERKE